jgi:hypothetical protein
MIVTIILIVVFFIVLGIINNAKDNQELKEKSLEEKFNVIINHICRYAFNDGYVVKPKSKRHLFIFHSDANNHMVELLYNQGVLTINWKYKYLQKELKFQKNLTNVRNLSLIEQNTIGESLVRGMILKIQEFKNEIWSKNEII